MKVNVKFANGNCLAFLGQGYITSDDKKVLFACMQQVTSHILLLRCIIIMVIVLLGLRLKSLA